jgi:hypothetical protein
VKAKSRPESSASSRRERQESPTVRRADTAPAPITALSNGRVRFGLIIVALVLATVVVIGADYAFGIVFGNGASATPSATPALQKNR